MWTSVLSVIVVINELMASNAGSVMSPATNFDSWVEFYNPSDQNVNLAGMYLCDDADHSWQMPSNIGSIPAKGYKVVWMGSSDIKSNQAPFKLDCDGGTIILKDKNGTVVDNLQYPSAMSRTAYARTTDGGNEWGWTSTPTPEASNSTAIFASERLDAPVVDKGSTIFKNSLSVKVTIPDGARLMYTTDGSLPAAPKSGTDYKGTEATKESKDGRFTFDNTTNLTLRLFKNGFLPSVPVTRSYIKTSSNYTLPIISIVGDKKYFTDPKIGIDCDGDGTNGKVASYTGGSPRNYAQEWDRPVNFSYISSDGEMLFNQDANIKISGGYTRTQQYRSFKLKASKVFDGQNRYDYPFFPQKPYNRHKTLLIRNGGNDIWRHNARFIDPALETIIQRSGIDVDVQSYVPVIEYVNGKLRGVFNMREPNNDDYAYANWGYDDEEIDAFENLTIKNGDDEAIKRIFELGKKINNEGAYEELQTLLDIDEFTNYMAVTFFLYNDDWPDNNMKAYRSRNDGRYRFISFDLDYAFKGCWSDSENNPFTNFARFKNDSAPRTSYNKDIVNLFLNLLNNTDYRQKFITTFCLMGGSVFEPSIASDIVNELLDKVKPMCQLMKQQYINDGHDPDRAASTIKNSLSGRASTMADYMKQFSAFGLSSTSKRSVELTTDIDGATLTLNGINVPYAYFKGYLFGTFSLEAKAPAGYRFICWKKSGTQYSTKASISVTGTSAIKLQACFTALTDAEKTSQGLTPIRINEVSAANGIHVNEYFKRNDWVELYNTTDKDIDVAGMYLSDNEQKPLKYQISKGDSQASTTIPAHGYLIVWCDKLESRDQLHASFKLDADGGSVLLTAADESWSDRLVYTAHQADQTVGRYPDGGSEIFVMNVPTIAQSNISTSYLVPVEQGDVTGIDIAQISAPGSQISLYNLAGQPVITPQRGNCYIARYTDAQGRVKTVKFIQK
ncbi:lamin tail domain-containing protein [uncultured Prevotella sp.]|uniref:lamin tail domain-containing protein n=1 Tax=uncultured Prevotella sp. TaxID=159272 RepID=UPI00258D6620|nr:lamin tail domain-containing protein [uncultured Prevotella sp.]